jgi:general L-amino acid transport system substrate-binding protein
MSLYTKRLTIVAVSLLLMVALVACTTPQAGDTVVQEVTRIVEVTRVVETDADAPPMVVAGDTLPAVRSRGVLRCGGNQAVPGFGYLDPDTNEFAGFDIDFCRAVAAAALGDANAVEIIPTTGTTRFPALQTGEVDVLIRNTTWTISRDTGLGLDFMPVTFFDGQGMMVRRDSGISRLEDLEGGTVCVQQGTTTEKNLADVFRAMNVNIESLVFPDAPSTAEAYDQGTCDGFTTDKSGLVSQQTLLSDPAAHTILEETMSKEPLAPSVRHGDNNWGDIVTWTVFCTFAGEEYGITSQNVDTFLGSDEPVIQNLLGETGDLGVALGISNDFCYQVISQVGNYEEIYNRNLGPGTPFNLPRGLNSQYTDGGLLYAMPFR